MGSRFPDCWKRRRNWRHGELKLESWPLASTTCQRSTSQRLGQSLARRTFRAPWASLLKSFTQASLRKQLLCPSRLASNLLICFALNVGTLLRRRHAGRYVSASLPDATVLIVAYR